MRQIALFVFILFYNNFQLLNMDEKCKIVKSFNNDMRQIAFLIFI